MNVVAAPPGEGRNEHYAGNRAPLLASPLIKLPVGSVRPDGWLATQLELEAGGFIGHLDEISRFCRFEGSAWASPEGEGEGGWEELPYWLKGFVSLGHLLEDRRIIGEARRWVEAVLSSQEPDGYFGPRENKRRINKKHPDLWPNMIMLCALRTHHEATGDGRVPPFMAGYFRWQAGLPDADFLTGFWPRMRAGDDLDNVYWLYNRTGEEWLLDLAERIHRHAASWERGVANWHGVNICQGFREPAQYYQQSKDARHLEATERNYETVMGLYGRAPGGMFGADENCRRGCFGPRQGAETCSMVELIYSDEVLLKITGDPVWADRCEEIAFNSLPASMPPDLKGLHYLTAPNMVELSRRNKSPLIQNKGDMLSYNPRQYRCCQHNVAFGWPYLAEHLWMATPGNGLAAAVYAPSKVEARVGDGEVVCITESTAYPFDEVIAFELSMKKPVRFPLLLRIPGWCREPKVVLNKEALPPPEPARGWIVLERQWRPGDRVRLELPMDIRLNVWEKNRGSVSVHRGPLAYSLKIGERWERYEGPDEWPAYEVYPTTPWNYGLVVNLDDPASSFEVVKREGEPAAQPFTEDNAPISLRVRGRLLPGWKLESNGLVGEVPGSPASSDAPVEEVTLIPMGCARLRVSAFPRVG